MTLRIAVYGVVDPIRNAHAILQLVKYIAGYDGIFFSVFCVSSFPFVFLLYDPMIT